VEAGYGRGSRHSSDLHFASCSRAKVRAAQLNAAAADANPRRVSRNLLLCRVRVSAAERQPLGAMSPEIAWVYLPLFALLLVAVAYEIRTDLILDVLTLPAILYMVVARALVGPSPWFTYAGAALVSAVALWFMGVKLPEWLGRPEMVGMGAVKLMAVVSAAVGFGTAMGVVAIFVVLATAIAFAAARWTSVDYVPSSPIIGIAVCVAFAIARGA
jgi:prepilin signal peptidase PulO-like enzyme (type II secretory pathway)